MWAAASFGLSLYSIYESKKAADKQDRANKAAWRDSVQGSIEDGKYDFELNKKETATPRLRSHISTGMI